MTAMDLLPIELFREIQTFLKCFDYWRFTSTKVDFQTVKYETIHYKIYVTTENLEENLSKIHHKLKDRHKQLIIDYSYTLTNLPLPLPLPMSFLPTPATTPTPNNNNSSASHWEKLFSIPCISLILRRATDMDKAKNWREFLTSGVIGGDEAREKERVDLKGNASLTSFNPITGDDNLPVRVQQMSITNFSVLSDVSALHTVRELSFSHCHALISLACLAQEGGGTRVQKVSVSSCPLLTVKGLENIPSVTLLACNSITDISPLTGNHKLAIRDCMNVRKGLEIILQNPNLYFFETTLLAKSSDLLYLQEEEEKNNSNNNNNKLTHLRLFHYRDSQPLPPTSLPTSIKRLEFQYATFTDLSPTFSHLSQVSLACMKITNLNHLKNVPYVAVSFANHLSDISGLGKNKKVIFISCPLIGDFSPIQNIPVVKLETCPGFIRGNDLANVKDLSISNCSSLMDVSDLGRVNSLEIRSCFNLKTLTGLREVPFIKIGHYTSEETLSSLEGLGNNQRITLENCPHLLEDSILKDSYQLVEKTINNFTTYAIYQQKKK